MSVGGLISSGSLIGWTTIEGISGFLGSPIGDGFESLG